MDFGIKKRPLLFLTIFYILGIFLSTLFQFKILFCILVGFFLLSIIFRRYLNEYNNIILLCILFMLLGSTLYFFTYTQVTGRFEGWNELRVDLTGTIEEVNQGIDKADLTIKLSNIKSETEKDVKCGKAIIYISGPVKDMELMPGDGITAKGQLALPKGIRNPGGFDYRRYLASKRVSATIYVSPGDFKIIKKASPISLKYSGYVLKNKIINSINSYIPKKQAALLNGMLIGYTDDLDENTSQEFRDAGLSHIMAVSGSNVAFIVAPLIFLFRKIGLSKRVTSIMLIPVLVLFIYITGFSASVARAVIMAVIVLIGKLLYRDTDTLTLIALSMLILLIYNPILLFDAGFQLSYGATLGIILFYKSVYQFILKIRIPTSIAALLGVTISAQIGVLPISVYHFNRVSIISVISNLLVVPTTEIITIIGFLMVIVGGVFNFLGKIIAAANILLLSFILEITKISAALPYAAVNLPTPNLPQILAFYGFAIYFLRLRPNNRILNYKKEVLFSFIVILVFVIPSIIPKPFTIYFLDVGQGDSIFIRTDTGKNILIDGGGYTSLKNRDKTMGETVILPFLMDAGVTRLDMVVLTHGHDDHMAGLMDVLKNITVKNLILPRKFGDGNELDKAKELARNKHIPVYEAEAGGIINIDKNTSFNALFPNRNFSELKPTLNNTSLVLQLNHKGRTVLFTGDMEESAEEFLLKNGVKLKSDVIKLGHHGSSTSSSRDFLNAVNPSMAVISVGKNNFGHPSPSVLGRVGNMGSKLYRTDESGAVILTLKGDSVNIKRMVDYK